MPSQPAQSQALIYNASNPSTFESKADYRYQRREAMRMISGRDRLKKCGAVPHGPITLNLKNNMVIQKGFTTCGSVWGCPVCSAKILAFRQKEVEFAMNAWVAQGGYFVFETLTLCHRQGDTVAKQRFGLKVGWEAITYGSFATNHKRAGQEGYLRIIEPTYGPHGFHLHMHVLRFMKGELSDAQLNQWSVRTFRKWQTSIASVGLLPPSSKGHLVMRVHDFEGIKGYFTKGFDNPALNVPGNTSNSHWKLLSLAIAKPKSRHTFAWRTWESESLQMRQMTWSRDIRANLGMNEDLEDEVIANSVTPLLQIEPGDVHKYGHSGRVQSQLRSLLTSGNLGEAENLLAREGIAFRSFVGETNSYGEGVPFTADNFNA